MKNAASFLQGKMQAQLGTAMPRDHSGTGNLEIEGAGNDFFFLMFP